MGRMMFGARRLWRGGYHVFAIPQDRDPIRDFERSSIACVMKMIDTSFAQPLDQREEVMLFLRGQRRRRLVEYDDLRVVMNGPGNFDHLLF